MIRRTLSFIVAVAVLCSCMTATVHAAEPSGWKEVLEYNSLNADGSNIFTISGQSGSLKIPLDTKQRLRKIDMLIWHPTGQRFTGATVTVDTVGTNTLEVLAVGGNICRVTGYLPNAWYTDIKVDFKKASTGAVMYELLSCKVTTLGVQDFVASGYSLVDNSTKQYPFSAGIEFGPDELYPDDYYLQDFQLAVHVTDWQKYDHLSIWGSVLNAHIASMRATIGTSALPMEVSYIGAVESDVWTEIVFDVDPSTGGIDNTGASLASPIPPKVLYDVEIDLSSADRTLDHDLILYITGQYQAHVGTTFLVQYVNGSVFTAETEKVTWWNKFTAFFTDLFGKDTTESDAFQDEASQQKQEMDDLNNELQEVTKPPVSDVQTDIDDYVDPGTVSTVSGKLASLTNDSLIVSMLMITLIIALVAYILFGKR